MNIERETLRLQPNALRPGVLRLIVLGAHGHSTHSLPATGSVVLGRGAEADIRIDEASISRRHAVLHLDPPLRLEDLGSANGTRVRDRALRSGEAAEMVPGDTAELGGVLVVVQRETPVPRPPRLVTHDYFEARLEDEVGRAQRGGVQFAVLRLRAGAGAADAMLAVVAVALRPGDVVAVYGPGEFEALLVDVEAQAAERAALALAGSLTSLGSASAVGLACFPRDARTPGALLAAANEALAHAPVRPGAPPPAPAPEAPPVLVQGAMDRVRKMVERVASSDISVVLLGETGAGKSLLAAEIHKKSLRARGPFVSLTCAAVAESLLESELFGHEKGAFTGALQAREGLFESADGGTVFLDEVGEMPLSMQAKLLEVLEERAVRRVGGTRKKAIDVRVISATNRDLEAATIGGAFRSDLWFRLNGIALVVPPLRERQAEIEGLARGFIAHAAKSAGRSPPEFSAEALEALRRHPWPGNIRELRNAIERAVLLCGEGPIAAEHLPAGSKSNIYAPAPAPAAAAPLPPAPAGPAASTDDPREDERRRIAQALEQCGGNQGRAAQLLGISRRTLVSRLNELGLPRPRKR